MKTFFVALALVLASSALALELPASMEFNLIDDAGNVVGAGELTEEGLELELLARFETESAFVTLVGVDADGNPVELLAQIGAGGYLLIDFQDVGGAVAAAGGEVEVEFEDEVEPADLVDEFEDADEVAEEAAEVVEDAAERAAENAADAAADEDEGGDDEGDE